MTNSQINKWFNDISSFIIGYYDETGSNFTINNEIKEELQNLIEIWDNDNRILYRGFPSRSVNTNFWKYIFTVGEKGAYFRNKANIDVSKKSTNYFSNQTDSSQKNYEDLLSELQSEIIPKYKHKEMLGTKELNLYNEFEKYRKNNELDYTLMYYLILTWLHNIGKATGLKNDSPFISTTTSLDVALEFQDKESDSKYVLVILLVENKISDYFDTNNLNKILKQLGINWHENINKEIMFKDSIFPHSILGIIEKKKNETKLILNPNLIKFLKESKCCYKTKASTLLKKGIPIDDKNFNEGLESLGYKKMTEQLPSKTERTIFDKDGKKYDVSPVNPLNSVPKP